MVAFKSDSCFHSEFKFKHVTIIHWNSKDRLDNLGKKKKVVSTLTYSLDLENKIGNLKCFFNV